MIANPDELREGIKWDFSPIRVGFFPCPRGTFETVDLSRQIC